MNVDHVTRLRRLLLLLSASAAVLAVVVALTGGFVIHFAFFRLSLRSPRNSSLVALLSGLAVWAFTPDWRRRTHEQLIRCRRASSALAATLSSHWRWLKWVQPAVFITLVGIGLEIYQWAGARPLWLDEEMIALNVRDRALTDLAGTLWLAQSAPLGWLALQRTVLLVFGTSEHALRLVPMLFGIATLVGALWIGQRWMSPVGAAVLALLCSFGQWLSFYSLELKHYSADAFSGLLPALAAWAMEPAPDGSAVQTRRVAVWWVAAAVGHWFSNGALLVTPACALVLFIVLLKRGGRRAVWRVTLPALAWLVSFGLLFVLTVRPTLGNELLFVHWAGEFPSPSADLGRRVAWLAGQLEPFAINPGGTGLWAMFWLSAAGGFALSASPLLGVVLAPVLLSAFVLGALGLVPLYQRVSLWVVPALYIGIALFADSAVRFGRNAYRRRSWTRAAFAVVIALIGFQLCADVFRRGKQHLQVGRPVNSNHELDDRTAVKWLMEQRQPGDAVMAMTLLSLPAVWWYGRIPISDPALGGSRHSDGGPVLVVEYASPRAACGPNELGAALDGRRRVLVYFGFGSDRPPGFEDLVLESLGRLGVIAATRAFAENGRAAVVNLTLRPQPQGTVVDADRTGAPANALARDGCISVRPARRW